MQKFPLKKNNSLQFLVHKPVFFFTINPMKKAIIFQLSEETLLQEVNISYQRPLPDWQ